MSNEFNNMGFNVGGEDGQIFDLFVNLSGNGQIYSRKIETPGNDSDNAFNLTRFNTMEDDILTDYLLDFALDMTGAVNLFGEAAMQADFTRSYILVADAMTGEGQILVQYIREKHLQANRMSGEARLSASANRYHIDYIEFDGEFRPGDRIVIDSNTLTVTINGQNALQQTTGDFFDLSLGNNKITYMDTSGSRNVILRITWRDKFV